MKMKKKKNVEAAGGPAEPGGKPMVLWFVEGKEKGPLVWLHESARRVSKS